MPENGNVAHLKGSDKKPENYGKYDCFVSHFSPPFFVITVLLYIKIYKESRKNV